MVLLQSEVDIAVIGSGWSTKARDHQCLRACEPRHEGKVLEKVMPMDTSFRRFHTSASLLAFLESI